MVLMCDDLTVAAALGDIFDGFHDKITLCLIVMLISMNGVQSVACFI